MNESTRDDGAAVVDLLKQQVKAAAQNLGRLRPPGPQDAGVVVTIGLSAPLARLLFPTCPFDLIDGRIHVDVALDGTTIREWRFEDGDNTVAVGGDLRVVLDDDTGAMLEGKSYEIAREWDWGTDF